MSPSLIKLVRSLSKSEKRDFQLLTKKHKGYKQYDGLFKIIISGHYADPAEMKQAFTEKHPDSSFDATASYLQQLVLNTLMRAEQKRNTFFQLHHGLMQLQLLKERNLDDLWLRELGRLKHLAASVHYPMMNILLKQEELGFLSANNFMDLDEKQLIEKQQKGREALIDMRHNFEHTTLYDLIKLRLIRQGSALGEKKQKKINDLLLGELSIINSRTKHTLQSRREHLMFQSFFFTNIGDHQSALQSMFQLHLLYEKNPALWKQTPLDYITLLDDTLSSLRAESEYAAMEIYIEKLHNLDQDAQAPHIRSIAANTAFLYQIIMLIERQKFTEACSLIEDRKAKDATLRGLIDEGKSCEIYFYSTLVYFTCGKLKAAQRTISSVLNARRTGDNSLIIRAASLLNLIFYYTDRDFEYLEYAVRSYRRMYYGKDKMLQIEKLVLKTIKENPATMYRYKKDQLAKNLDSQLCIICQDPTESKLLQYYDFSDWIRRQYA